MTIEFNVGAFGLQEYDTITGSGVFVLHDTELRFTPRGPFFTNMFRAQVLFFEEYEKLATYELKTVTQVMELWEHEYPEMAFVVIPMDRFGKAMIRDRDFAIANNNDGGDPNAWITTLIDKFLWMDIYLFAQRLKRSGCIAPNETLTEQDWGNIASYSTRYQHHPCQLNIPTPAYSTGGFPGPHRPQTGGFPRYRGGFVAPRDPERSRILPFDFVSPSPALRDVFPVFVPRMVMSQTSISRPEPAQEDFARDSEEFGLSRRVVLQPFTSSLDPSSLSQQVHSYNALDRNRLSFDTLRTAERLVRREELVGQEVQDRTRSLFSHIAYEARVRSGQNPHMERGAQQEGQFFPSTEVSESHVPSSEYIAIPSVDYIELLRDGESGQLVHLEQLHFSLSQINEDLTVMEEEFVDQTPVPQRLDLGSGDETLARSMESWFPRVEDWRSGGDTNQGNQNLQKDQNDQELVLR